MIRLLESVFKFNKFIKQGGIFWINSLQTPEAYQGGRQEAQWPEGRIRHKLGRHIELNDGASEGGNSKFLDNLAREKWEAVCKMNIYLCSQLYRTLVLKIQKEKDETKENDDIEERTRFYQSIQKDPLLEDPEPQKGNIHIIKK